MQLHRTLTLTAAVAAAFASTTPAMASTFASMSQAGATYLHATSGGFNAEIAAYDAQTRTLWVSGVTGVDVLNVAPTGLSFNSRIDLSSFGAINSIAIHNGIAAFAIESTANRELPGIVQFYNTSTRSLTSGINSVTVGSLPDMLTFTADGSKLLVANEGTPNTYPSATDPTGGVSIIRMSDRTVTNVGLGGSIPTTGSGLRGVVPFNYEPEYIAVNQAGTKAWVTLQEHNAVATLDLTTNQFTGITGLGLKDYSLLKNAIDPSNTGPVSLIQVNLKGAYQPDSVVAYDVGAKTFLVMANEGDAQDQEESGDIGRAGALYGTAAPLNRINVIKDMSSAENLVSMGGRSFSIRDTDGTIVYDSGNILEAEAIARGIYDDGRSDDKGVEPEGVALQTINGRTFAFIGLERTTKGAVAIFDITDPANSSFVDMIVTNGTKRPEGVVSFAQDGMFYLAIANEGASATDGMSTALYSLAPVPEPETWALLLAGLGVLGLRARRQKSR
jgi:DNA-binding beta-propeller fold protein YncE